MIRNYLKVSLRTLSRYKFFSVINILGLSTGIAGALFISLYLYDEWNYDKFHSKGNRIYRINLHAKLSEQEVYTTNSSPPLARALIDEIPGVENVTRLRYIESGIFRNGTIAFKEQHIYAADSNFFRVFDFKLLHGNPDKVLAEPNTLVLSVALAEKYFNSAEEALGKTLMMGNNMAAYQVTGVMENMRSDSHLKFNAIISSVSLKWLQGDDWLQNILYTYYTLAPEADPGAVDTKLDAIMERNVTPALQQLSGKTLTEFREEGGIYEYLSFPLHDIHLHSYFEDEQEPPGDMAYVYTLAGIGLFIVLLASINFMNLATARSAGRAKETGLRKALGSPRSALIGQFFCESMLYAVAAGLIALVIVYALLPSFNLLSGKTLAFGGITRPVIAAAFLLIVVFTGLLAGSYPAFYLTGFKVTEVLKGRLRTGMRSGLVRSGLVIFQFWISIVLIICTAIIFQQLEYMQDKTLGIDKDHVIAIEDVSRLKNDRIAFKDQVLSNSFVLGASYCNNRFPGSNNNTVFRSAGSEQDIIAATYYCDYDHVKALGLEMAGGRFFSEDHPSDTVAVVVNEAVVKQFGWTNPTEESIINYNYDEPLEMEVIGVVKNFHFESLKFDVLPLILVFARQADWLYVRYSGEDTNEVIAALKANWEELAGGEPFQYAFLDDNYDAAFREEQRLGSLFTVFTATAIFIAALGLFALAAFMAEQRTKEIGIRKVMGASPWRVNLRMNKEFARLVLIAFVLSVYPAYYIMDQWLSNFTHRVAIGYEVFVMSGALAFVIAGLTVSYQSLKAARINPVKALRYE